MAMQTDSSDVMVNINCSDKNIKVNLNKLSKYRYFNELLFQSTSKITHETITKFDTNNKEYMMDIYIIPHISIECTSVILLTLMNHTYLISPGKYDGVADMLFYNNLYEMGCNIHNSTWGFNVKEYFDLLLFVKQERPNDNVYTFISGGGFRWSTLFIEYSFEACVSGKLDASIIPDLFEYFEYCLYQKYHMPYDNRIYVNILDCVIYCYTNNFNSIIKKYVNSKNLKLGLHYFVKGNNYDCTKSQYDRTINILEFNNILNKTYEKITQLGKFGIIDVNEIGNISEYAIY